VAASLGLPRVLEASGERKEEGVESNARDWRFGLLVLLKLRIEGELGIFDLSPGDETDEKHRANANEEVGIFRTKHVTLFVAAFSKSRAFVWLWDGGRRGSLLTFDAI
jgi:hypothetical protein